MRHATRITILALAAAVALPNTFSNLEAVAPTTSVGPAASAEAAPLDPPGVYGADEAAAAEIREAIRLFEAAGLTLPELRIYVHQTREGCNGHNGLFSKGGDLHRIDLCAYIGTVARHELAHVWERHNLDDAARRAFMEASGAVVWNDSGYPHPSRGIERAAWVIARGVQDKPIQRVASSVHADDLRLYELLTGSPSPRIEHWDDAIPEKQRPAPELIDFSDLEIRRVVE